MADLAHAASNDTDLHGDPDARHWAERFIARLGVLADTDTDRPGQYLAYVDEPTLLAWFAGAIETGRMVADPVRDHDVAHLAETITCPVCHRTSHNRNDVIQGYCGYCRDWTSGRRNGYARHLLREYLHRLGLASPQDAAEQVTHTMLADMVERLEVILADHHVPAADVAGILRTLILGCLPGKAETQMRIQAQQAAADAISRTAASLRFPVPGAPGFPPG